MSSDNNAADSFTSTRNTMANLKSMQVSLSTPILGGSILNGVLKWALLSTCLIFCAVPCIAIAAPQTESLLQNGSFEKWNDEAPVGWKVEPGIFNGDSKPLSKVRKGKDNSIEIFGNKRTLAWNIVTQTVELKPGEIYRLTFEAKTKGLKREANQYDNCHVGFWYKNAQGQTVGNQIEPIETNEFKKYEIKASAPDGSKKADISLTLSKTGRLFVKNVKLEILSDVNSFDLLVDAMKKKYSYFELKQIDFDKLTDKYRDKANAAADSDEFTEVVADMLAEMKDGHTWIMRNGRRYAKFAPPFKTNYNFAAVDEDLKYSVRVGNFALVGKTTDGFGYVRITSLYEIARSDVTKLQNTIAKLVDTPGMIIDLRNNGGGDEPTAQSIARMFADKEYVYAKQKVRQGDGFTKPYSRKLKPMKGKAYTKPMVCLIGPRAVSSGEGFALMMKALDHCQAIGQPTRGSSGNPAGVTLPNGVEVWFSRWVAMEADGTPIEDRGVMPDIQVEHYVDEAVDPAYAKAIEILKEKTAK